MRSFTVNPGKATLLGDGVYVRRWHSDAAGIELGVRNGDREYQGVLLSPQVIKGLLRYLYVEGHKHEVEAPAHGG